MANDRHSGVEPLKKEREVNRTAGQKRLGEDGLPQEPPTPKEQDTANHTKTTVKHSLQRG